MNQNFTAEQLIKLCKKSEFIEHGCTKPDLLAELEAACTKIINGTFELKIITSPNYYYTESLVDKLILRKLNDNIKRLYKDEQSNRRFIVYQVKTLLDDECPFWIYKTDISSFYDSIDRQRLIEKLKGDTMLSYFSIWLINKVFSHPDIIIKAGLPRGLPISATLSELYMRKFDRFVRGVPSIFYYARFVDDIIIFYNKENNEKFIKENIDNNLIEIGLARNEDKSSVFSGERIFPQKPLEYLGYKFVIKKLKKGKKDVIISIANSKIKKIKSRIVYSFLDFIKTKDFNLLENRIRFLTGNFNVKSAFDNKHNLKAGIYYNYIYINTLKDLDELNLFYHKILNAKSHSFGAKLSAVLGSSLRIKLKRYSFKHGFKNKVQYRFNASIMQKINNCWK